MELKISNAVRFKYELYSSLACFLADAMLGKATYKWRTTMNEDADKKEQAPEQVETEGTSGSVVPEVQGDIASPELETSDDTKRGVVPTQQEDNVSVPGYNFIAIETY